jgi:hypothetical protein
VVVGRSTLHNLIGRISKHGDAIIRIWNAL